MPNTALDSLSLARLALDAISEKQGGDPAAYDVRKQSPFTDYVVVATGQNGPHLKALVNKIRLKFKGVGLPCLRQSGAPDSGWIMADYFDVVIHLFLPETRAHYAFDDLFHDAPKAG